MKALFAYLLITKQTPSTETAVDYLSDLGAGFLLIVVVFFIIVLFEITSAPSKKK